ncbi:MAG: DUF998 domain-containing protein [Rhodoglobus sp.]
MQRGFELSAAIGGSVLVIAALGIIWGARLTIPRELYVSELGAQGMPTAEWFRIALLLIVAGGSLVAWSGRRIRSSGPVLGAWTPAVSLWIGCSLFLFASQVTCTSGCPLPYGDSFTWQDFSHTLAAVLAFAAACWAMLQSAFAQGRRVLAILSATTGILVAVIAATGGLFSLFRFQEELGSRLEFIATTLAIAWLVMFGGTLVARTLKPSQTVTEQELVSAA